MDLVKKLINCLQNNQLEWNFTDQKRKQYFDFCLIAGQHDSF